MTDYINTYNELCEKVKRWSAAYYEQDAPAVTDEEYDRAMHEIRDLEAAHPELVTSDSPTQVVGGKRVIGIPVEHRVPMLSLLDVFSDDEVRDFTASVEKEYPDATFSIERKIDGLSLSLMYAKPAGPDCKMRMRTISAARKDEHDYVKSVGTTMTMKNGSKATCIAYHGVNNITVEFEDGFVLYHARWNQFVRGALHHNQKNINE